MTTSALFRAWRASPEEAAARAPYAAALGAYHVARDAVDAADAAYEAARDAWMAGHKEKRSLAPTSTTTTIPVPTPTTTTIPLEYKIKLDSKINPV